MEGGSRSLYKCRRRTRDLWYFTLIHASSKRGRLNDADPFGNWKRFLFVQKTRLMRFCWLWNRSPGLGNTPRGYYLCSDNLTRLIFVVTGPGHDNKILILLGFVYRKNNLMRFKYNKHNDYMETPNFKMIIWCIL